MCAAFVSICLFAQPLGIVYIDKNNLKMFITSIAVLLRIVSNPVANVFQKRLTQGRHDPLAVNFVSYFLLSLFCIALSWRVDWASLPPEFWFYAVVAGVFGAVGNGFLVKALAKGELSILGPVNSYKSVVGMVVGIFLLGEVPSLMGLLGVAVIIFGSYFVFETMDEGFTWSLLKNQEIRYRIYAMVLTAIEAVFIKKVIIHSDTLVSFMAWCWFGALFAFVQLLLSKADIQSECRKATWADAAACLALVACIGTMQFTTNFVFSRIDVGYGLALFQLSTIVSVLLGYRLYHEQGIAKKLVGSAIMIAGSVMVIFS